MCSSQIPNKPCNKLVEEVTAMKLRFWHHCMAGEPVMVFIRYINSALKHLIASKVAIYGDE
jgi:hypothetical protein